jgi:acyl carrier protein
VASELKPLSFPEFQALLAGILEVDVDQMRPEAYFVTDLGVDSLRLAEMLLEFQALGLEFPPDLAWRIQTVGEAYQYYLGQTGR